MQGSFSISRRSDGLIAIRVEDMASRTQFLEAMMTPEALALALTGMGGQECAFILRAKNVGKVRQAKTERVPVPDGVYFTSDRDKVAYVKDYEIDGWVAYLGDLGNHHRFVGQENGMLFYTVTFARFVDPVTAEAA